MPTFTSFSNILPDPTHPVTDAGNIATSGTPGPGFSAIGFSSVTDTQVSRTISGRGIQRDGGSQHWEFTIQYNPMFREQFEVVDSFLTMRNPRKNPFYIILPQYAKPRDPTFNGSNNTYVKGNHEAGSQTLLVTHNTANFVGKLRPGDFFNISDGNDFNHQKAYKVGAVETNSDWQAGTAQPAANELRLHIAPPLQRDTYNASKLVLIEPKFRVITKGDVQSHDLNTDNLYSFSLAVEEIQP